MSEESESPEPIEDGVPPTRQNWWDEVPPADLRLEWLVILSERIGLSVGLTLTVGGTVITGRLSRAGETFATFADGWRTTAQQHLERPDLDDFTRTALEWFVRRTTIDSGLAEASSRELGASARPSYVHLADAHFVLGGRLYPEDEGLPLRIRIDRVDAWTPVTVSDGQPF